MDGLTISDVKHGNEITKGYEVVDDYVLQQHRQACAVGPLIVCSRLAANLTF
jgi:hypothetical protein